MPQETPTPKTEGTVTYRPSWKRILLVVGIFIITVLPVTSLIDLFYQINEQQGQAVTREVLASPVQILQLFINNSQLILNSILTPTLIGLLKWGLILLGIWLSLFKLPLAEKFYSKFNPLAGKIISDKKIFLTTIFLLIVIITSLLSYSIRQHLPDNTDSSAQFFHAKIFAMGELYAAPPAPDIQRFFGQPFLMMRGNKWYSQYAPGHIFFLTLGLLIGAPWLINPLLSACTALFLYKTAERLYDIKTASLAAVLFLSSPLINFYAGGFMNCVTSLFFTTLFLLYLVKSEQETGLINPLLCGIFIGGTANVRPLTAFSIALPFALRWLYLTWKDPKRHLNKLLMIILGISISLSVLCLFNYFTNGHPLLFGNLVYNSIGDAGTKTIGFGKSLFGITHTPFRALTHTLQSLNKLNGQLFGWFIPSFIFGLFFWLTPADKKTWDWLHITPILCLLFFYFFYSFSYVRFFYSLLPFFILLTARGILTSSEGIHYYFNKIPLMKVKGSLYLLLGGCLIYSLGTNMLPDMFDLEVGRQKNQVYNIVKSKGVKNALVFMEGGYCNWGIFIRGFVHNSPTLDTEVVYALDRDEDNNTLMRRYPDRTYYRYTQKEGRGKLEKLN